MSRRRQPLAEHAAHVYAASTDSGGVHNCRRCGKLVVWGLTNKGNRAEFDFPTSDDGYVNHHVTCTAAVKAGNLRIVK